MARMNLDDFDLPVLLAEGSTFYRMASRGRGAFTIDAGEERDLPKDRRILIGTQDGQRMMALIEVKRVAEDGVLVQRNFTTLGHPVRDMGEPPRRLVKAELMV